MLVVFISLSLSLSLYIKQIVTFHSMERIRWWFIVEGTLSLYITNMCCGGSTVHCTTTILRVSPLVEWNNSMHTQCYCCCIANHTLKSALSNSFTVSTSTVIPNSALISGFIALSFPHRWMSHYTAEEAVLLVVKQDSHHPLVHLSLNTASINRHYFSHCKIHFPKTIRFRPVYYPIFYHRHVHTQYTTMPIPVRHVWRTGVQVPVG